MDVALYLDSVGKKVASKGTNNIIDMSFSHNTYVKSTTYWANFISKPLKALGKIVNYIMALQCGFTVGYSVGSLIFSSPWWNGLWIDDDLYDETVSFLEDRGITGVNRLNVLYKFNEWYSSWIDGKTDLFNESIQNATSVGQAKIPLNAQDMESIGWMQKYFISQKIKASITDNKDYNLDYSNNTELNTALNNLAYSQNLMTEDAVYFKKEVSSYNITTDFSSYANYVTKCFTFKVHNKVTDTDIIISNIFCIASNDEVNITMGDPVNATFNLLTSAQSNFHYDVPYTIDAKANLRYIKQTFSLSNDSYLTLLYDGTIQPTRLFNRASSRTNSYVTSVSQGSYLTNVYGFNNSIVSEFSNGMTSTQLTNSENYEITLIAISDAVNYESIVDPALQNVTDLSPILITEGSGDLTSGYISLNENSLDTALSIDPAIANSITDSLPAISNTYIADPVTEKVIATDPITIPDAVDTVNNNPDVIPDQGSTTPFPLPIMSGDCGLFKCYELTKPELNSLGSVLWSSGFLENFNFFVTDPKDCLISLRAYPFNVISGSSQQMTVGNKTIDVTGRPITELYQTVSIGSISIKPYFNNYMDYAPYTQIQIYLPFIGTVDLDPNDVMNSVITVNYRVEVLTGGCTASITVNKDGKKAVLYQFSGSMGMTLPLTSVDYSSLYTSSVGTLLKTGVGMATSNPMMVADAGLGLLNNSTPSAKTMGAGGNSNMTQNLACFAIIYRNIPDTPNGYQNYIGKTVNEYGRIGNYKDLVKLTSYKMSVANLTETERADLENLLETGIYV